MRTKILSLLNTFEFIPVNSCLLIEEPTQGKYNELFIAINELVKDGLIRYRNCEGYAIELNK